MLSKTQIRLWSSWVVVFIGLSAAGCSSSNSGVDNGTDGTDSSTLAPLPEDCDNVIDDDLDGQVDCEDADCATALHCTEDCGNEIDDNGDLLVDCDDPVCKGIAPECGEVCGDHADNDSDGLVDCEDPDCAELDPPCGDDTNTDGDTGGGTMCDYGTSSAPHPCACDDGLDNDSDGQTDADDIQCFGPFDDDEATYSTGIPGDNNGSKGDKECPFDGNSGVGNDGLCCNPDNPEQNVTPNGCDNKGCCEVDVNGNGTGEHVWVGGTCVFAPACGTDGTHGCPCATTDACDPGETCIADNDNGAKYCSGCEACTSNTECENPCDCAETCFGGFERPADECGAQNDTDTNTTDTDTVTGTCALGRTSCPNGNADCDTASNEVCLGGCCYGTCPAEVTPCKTTIDCPTDKDYYCVTGCCIEAGPVV